MVTRVVSRSDPRVLAATAAITWAGHALVPQAAFAQRPARGVPYGAPYTVTIAGLGQVARATASAGARAATSAAVLRAAMGQALPDVGAALVLAAPAPSPRLAGVLPFGTGVQNINGDYTNNATLTASGTTDPQTINVNNGTFTQTGGGVLNAVDGGLITLNNTNVVGGVLRTSGSGTITANNSGGNFLTGVTLAGTLDLASNQATERVAGGLTLGQGSTAGLVNINSNSALAVEGSQTIGGTGTIVFGSTGSGNRLNIESPGGVTGTLTIGPNVTIRGQNGTIGGQAFEGGPNALVNNGTIRADVSGGTITIVNAAVANTGTLGAANGGTLNLQSAVTNTGAGQLTAASGGVLLLNGTSVTGGTIATSGGGLFQATNSGNNFLNGVTVSGGLDLASNQSTLRVGGGGLTLAGNATVSINNNSALAVDGTQSLAGSGTVVFGATGSGNRLNIETPGGAGTTGTLTIGQGVTVRGQNGTIGGQAFAGGTNALVNNGTISADVAGGTITIINAPVTNNGTLQAANGGTLVLNSNVTGNAGSQIAAGAGSIVLQNGVTVSGQLNTAGSGSFQASNSGNNYLNAATLNGALDLASNQSTERVTGGLTLQNGSTISINSNSVLAIDGTQTLGGSGTILLGGTGSGNRLNIESPGGATATLTVGPNVTIRGANGTIGAQVFEGGPNALVNNGVISAEVAGGTITIVNAPVTNNGTLQAVNGGTLVFNSNVTGLAGSQIIAGAGSVVYQNGVTLSGQINTSGSGLLQASNSGNNFLDNVTFRGALDLASNQSTERVTNGLTLQNGATINVNGNSVLAFGGTQTVGGTGTVVFGSTGSGDRLNIESPGGTLSTLTVGPNVTIRGQNGTIGGQVFDGGPNALVNNGTISADVAGGTITIVNAPVTNNGVLQAQNGGTLVLNSNVTSAGSGQLLAGNASLVYQNGVTLSGQVNTAGTGTIQASNSGNNFANAVTLNGTLDLAANQSTERVTNGLALQSGATVSINSNSVLAVEGSQTIGGSGSITFGGTGSGNRLNIESPGGTTSTLTVGPNVTIHGINGTIGGQVFEGGPNALVNAGTINADGGGTIAVVNAPVTNNGLLRAQNGTLALQTPLSGTGTLQVDAAGVVNLTSNTAVTQGTLAIGAAGATLNNGTQNITLTTDYTNASAGTGNAFNRHAGVTGSGQILAGGNVAQTIAGANVTNGATSNATLTIGNVRVGANSTTYNITNTGTTGPALRGAIQTSVNGATLTDARLSGSGVTASNYGPAAPGGAAAYTVTFTTTQAGALAPLSGQSVNLRSTYDNIGDQKLNIVLGSGAAAYQTAAGQLNSAPLNFGTVQVGQSVSRTLSFTNVATGPNGYVEDLNVGFGSATGTGANRITGAGSITGLAAGGTNASNMTVTVNTTSAGVVSGAIGITYASAGTVNGASNGLGVLALPGASYGVSGTIAGTANVVDQAAPVVNTPTVNLGSTRVGSAALAGVVSVTNQATGNQQAALNASIAGNAPATASGSFSLLSPGATDASTLKVGLGTATAGVLQGTATVSFVSDASNIGGCAPNCQMALGSQNVTVTGKVYTAATGQVAPTAVDFGIVHVGDAVAARGLTVTNTAATTALNDVLVGGVSATGAGFTGSGTLGSGVAAGASNSTGLTVGLNTAAAGRFTGSAAVTLASHDADLADLALGTTTVALTGQVNNYALGGFARTGGAGAFGQLSASDYTLDFGTVASGSGAVSANLTANNLATGFADFLNGSFSVVGSGFTLGGFNPFTGVAAGGSVAGLSVSFSGATAGAFSEVVTLNSYGTNASGYRGDLGPVRLTIRGAVGGASVVPEPSTWAMVAAGLAGVGGAAYRRRRRTTPVA